MMGPKDKPVFTVIYMNTGTDDCPEWEPIGRIIEKPCCREWTAAKRVKSFVRRFLALFKRRGEVE